MKKHVIPFFNIYLGKLQYLTNLNEAIGDDFPYHPSRAESGEVVI